MEREPRTPSQDEKNLLPPNISAPEQKRVTDALSEAVAEIKRTKIFPDDYLQRVPMIVHYTESEVALAYKDGQAEIELGKLFPRQEFVRGQRIDFIALAPPEYLHFDRSNLPARRLITDYLLPEDPTYAEFIAHEAGHNMFDQHYHEKYGDYSVNSRNETDVTEEFRDKIRNKINALLKKHNVPLDASRFPLRRQQIAEIEALCYQREFCRRSDINWQQQAALESKARRFVTETDTVLSEINQQYNREGNEGNKMKTSIEDFYEENHNLALVIAPLLDKEYPEFNDRLQFLWADS